MKHSTVHTAFDSYTLNVVIGEGGCGQVYEAKNSSGEFVALKTMKPGLSRDKQKRFKNELLFCQNRPHKNIVPVLDHGAAQIGKDAVSFYVMPLYPKTLGSLIKQGIAPEKVLPYFSQMLDGVEAAHLLDVTHRDLKPANILFDEDSETLLIADFGAAEFRDGDLYTAIETKAGERIANFEYAAPEQRRPGAEVDRRADIYALGLMLNEMFTQQVPSGTNHRVICSVSTDYGYLDDLVSLMRCQSPNARPASIQALKARLVALGDAFIRFQRLDDLKNRVVPATQPPESIPVVIKDVQYDGQNLLFAFDRELSHRWRQVFRQLPNYRSLLGREPMNVEFPNSNTAALRAAEHEIQVGVECFRQWVDLTNGGLPAILADEARQGDEETRANLRAQVLWTEKQARTTELARKALGIL